MRISQASGQQVKDSGFCSIEMAAFQQLHHTIDVVVGGNDLVGIVVLFGFDDACFIESEEEEVLAPAFSRISILAPSRVPIVSAPFIMNFMLPVPDASLPAVEICSDSSVPGR